MTGEFQAAPIPVGCYLTPRKQRIGRLVLIPICILPLIGQLTEGSGDLSSWYLVIPVSALVIAVGGGIAQWFVPLTILDLQGIRRFWFKRPKRITWADVFDAKFTSSWDTQYVLLVLWSGKQVRLYGVTEDAVEGIRRIAAENPAHPAHRQPFGPMTSHLHPAE
ncbi:MAG: hypothetical protein JWN96_3645 [Mycobacterium sp.]|nr:hypothetical protein [Mycobacterium sp.]